MIAIYTRKYLIKMAEGFKIYLPKKVSGKELSRMIESIGETIPNEYVCITRTLFQAKPNDSQSEVIEEYMKEIVITENTNLIERIRRFLGSHDTFEMKFSINCNVSYEQILASGIKPIEKYVGDEETLSSQYTAATEDHLDIIKFIVGALYNKLK
jgi:hypothetical protein